MDLDLKGKRALVTGSSSGIGEGIAICLAKEGVHVVVHGRKKEELLRVADHIRATGGKVDWVQGDLQNGAADVIVRTQEIVGELDILVNNAGAFPQRKWFESKPEDWVELFEINVVSMVKLIQAFVPAMKKRGWGRVIQIASVAGSSPSGMLPEYGVTKAANINMTKSLAKELGGSGVTANSVSPGPILTQGVLDMAKELAAKEKWGTNWEEIEKKIIEKMFPNMVRRFGKTEEVGNLVTFLASPLASYITGADLRIDGGRFA